MKRAVSFVALVCATAVLALLWGSTSASAAGGCPVGRSQMGCSIPFPLKGTTTPPRGESIPDVSDWQGTVNWPVVKGWELLHGWTVTGGIFKLGELSPDPYAATNAAALHKLGMAAIGYWFIRPTGAAAEGLKILTEAKAVGIRVVVLDEEVQGIQGYAQIIAPVLEHAGLTVVDYHSALNVLDTTAQGLGCWVADYGPSTPPSCTTGVRLAWQWTQTGQVPGISGYVDESISYGLLKLADPRTICFGPGATPKTAACRAVEKKYAGLLAGAQHWYRQFQTCIRRADGIKCERAEHRWLARRSEAIALRRRYS